MTAHPIDTEALRKLADAATPGPWSYPGEILGLPCSTVFAGNPKRTHAAYVAAMGPGDGEFIAAARTAVPALLDALAAAEHRATRAEAQSDIRGRAVAIYRERAREAEAERDRWHSMWRQRGVKHLAAEKRATRAEAERDCRRRENAELRDELVATQEYGAKLAHGKDEAEARIKAVRALHTGTRWPGVTDKPICDACDQPRPCPTIRALDGDT